MRRFLPGAGRQIQPSVAQFRIDRFKAAMDRAGGAVLA
jgi:hypothetical protein